MAFSYTPGWSRFVVLEGLLHRLLTDSKCFCWDRCKEDVSIIEKKSVSGYLFKVYVKTFRSHTKSFSTFLWLSFFCKIDLKTIFKKIKMITGSSLQVLEVQGPGSLSISVSLVEPSGAVVASNDSGQIVYEVDDFDVGDYTVVLENR